jgi:hypothetical protein
VAGGELDIARRHSGTGTAVMNQRAACADTPGPSPTRRLIERTHRCAVWRSSR